MGANSNMEAAIELAEKEQRQRPATPIRTFEQIQQEWLDACRDTIVPLELELMLLGNRLLLEAHLSGQHEAYGKVAGGRK